MKNTILKIAGVKDSKALYKKHATEADFLKAYPEFALGGKMNIQAMQKFASGGSIFKDIGAGLYGVGEGLLDTVTLGATDQITDMGYKALQKAGGSTENEMREQDSIRGYLGALGGAGGMLVNPAGAGAGIGQIGKGLGEGISRGNESEEWARNTGQALNAAGAIGSIAYGNFGAAGTSGAANAGASAAGNASKLTGQSAKFAGSNFGKFAQTAGKYGSVAGQMGSVLQPMFNQQYGNNQGYKMGGQMQYAMGGMNVQPNAEAEHDELVTTNTPPQVVSGGEVKMISNNPYGTPDYYISGNNHGEGENGGGVKMNVDEGVFKGKLENPLTGNLFKKDFKKISFQENMFTKKLENGDAYAQNTANLILPVLAKTKKDMEMYQQAVLDNKKQAKDLRAGIMPGQSQGKMSMAMHGGMYAMGGIQESDYQTDPGNLSSLLRQKRANDAALLGIRSSFGPKNDTNNLKDNLVVTLNKAKDFDKELTNKINNHPEFKKAMGGRLPMYYMGGDNDPLRSKPSDEQVFGGSDEYGNYIPQANDDGYFERSFPDNPNPNYKFPHNEMNRYLNDANIANLNLQRKSQNTQSSFDPYTPAQNWNAEGLAGKINPNAGSPSGNTDTKVDTKVDLKDKGKGFDYKKAAGNLGQFALQNAGNIYDLGRSTQDNSKLNLSRMSPTFLDKTQDLQNNLRLYSEGKRQTAEASQGNASTYLSNMYANRASKLANDLNINTTYGNLNASIDNAAKLYNAGAIDKETMFKLQAEGMNRNLKGQALAGMSQNFLNQRNSDRQDDLDQQRLDLQKQYYKAFYDNQDRENQRRVDEITKGKSNKNSWLDCSSGNCVERTSDQTQSTQSTPLYFNQTERPDNWDAISRLQQAQDKMDKLKKGKK